MSRIVLYALGRNNGLAKKFTQSFPYQGIFLTQGVNRGFLHCKQILYHLSYIGSHTVSILQDKILVCFTSKSFTWGLLLTGGGTTFAAMMGQAGRGV